MYNVYMIQITAYLRTEADLKLWKKLPNKTEWLHQQLNAPTIQTLLTKDIKPLKDENLINKYQGNGNFIIKTKSDAKKAVKSLSYKPTQNWGA